MPLQATSGAASYDAFGGGVPVEPVYIEQIFSTYLYTGTGASQTITNGIDLSTKGGLVWTKLRSGPVSPLGHGLEDTTRGATKRLASNTTAAESTFPNSVTSFSSTGYVIGSDDLVNSSYGGGPNTYVSWTFRKQPKFFDIQTFTYPSSGSITVPHNLASTPGCVMVKMTSGSDNWLVYHRMANNGTNPSNYILQLNTTSAQINNFASWITVGSSSITFPSGALNPGSNFVMYLFAHNAGGFGLTGTDNVISCGSFTTDGSGNADVNLGYEPQWVLIKPTNEVNSWVIVDTMRGYSLGAGNAGEDARLRPNTSDAESTSSNVGYPTATGFYVAGSGSMQHIYIAIRRGPMKVPTDATKVFAPLALNNATDTTNTTGFPIDMQIAGYTSLGGYNKWLNDRLRGVNSVGVSSGGPYLVPNDTGAENSTSNNTRGWSNTGFNTVPNFGNTATAYWNFRRAPSYFDEVCYSPPSSAVNTYSHNLGVIPELMIIKTRDSARRWVVYTQTTGNTQALHLNTSDAVNSTGNNYFNSTSPTASVFTLDNGFADVCNGGGLGVAYLFATCAGVSKVTSFTGNGSSQTINCGFTAGSRFVMIKRTDSTGDWYVWDSARGIVSGNDPHLSLNSTAAEVTTDDTIDTDSTGFIVNQVSATNSNVNGASYIVLAIA